MAGEYQFTLDGPSVKDVTVSSGNVNYVGSKAMATLMMQAVGEKPQQHKLRSHEKE